MAYRQRKMQRPASTKPASALMTQLQGGFMITGFFVLIGLAPSFVELVASNPLYLAATCIASVGLFFLIVRDL